MKTIHAQKPVRTVVPATAPVSLTEAKAHLRVDFTDDDAVIQGYIDAAVSHLDGWGGILGRCMVTQTWRQDFPQFCDLIRLPFPDAQSATLAYLDVNGDEQAFTGFHLVSDAMGGGLVLEDGQNWPQTANRPDAVRVTGVYGYGGADDVPWSLKAAILLHVGTLYENRETLSERVSPNMAYEALVAPHRMVGV